jgi:hypothetical protein
VSSPDLIEQARARLAAISAELAPGADDNPLLPRVAAGSAPLTALAALAGEQSRIIPSDRRSFLLLATRASGTAASEFFALLAAGENLAEAHLPALAAAAGLDAAGLADYRITPGAQAYPAYVAALALGGRPADVVLALVANFAAWGEACGVLGKALREHYGFDDDACAFVDFFATPSPELEAAALAAVAGALEAGEALTEAGTYGRLLQAYEAMFWRTLADVDAP